MFSLFASLKESNVSSANFSPEMSSDKVSPGITGWGTLFFSALKA
jgi:hypothetical protein